MKDKRIDRIKQHYDIFINNKKFKVIDCKIHKGDCTLLIKTKIRGQNFLQSGHLVISIPSENVHEELNVAFRCMSDNTSIEHWLYTIL